MNTSPMPLYRPRPGPQHAATHRGTERVYPGLVGVLPPGGVPKPDPAAERLAPTALARLSLDPVAQTQNESAGIAQGRRSPQMGLGTREHEERPVASQQTRLVAPSLARPILHTLTRPRSSGIILAQRQPNRRIRDPYVRWSGRGPQRWGSLSRCVPGMPGCLRVRSRERTKRQDTVKHTVRDRNRRAVRVKRASPVPVE